MIPELVDIKGAWKVLPPGVHDATLKEVEECFAYNDRRRRLYEGLTKGLASLRTAGCRIVFIDGSYVSGKPFPGDFDACWDPCGVDATKLDPVLLDFSQARRGQKEVYGGEFFPSSACADGVHSFVAFFQVDRHTGGEKGIIRIRLQ